MSWGTYAHLSGAIELAQAATVKIGGGTAVMISDQFALTAALVVREIKMRYYYEKRTTRMKKNQLKVIPSERPYFPYDYR